MDAKQSSSSASIATSNGSLASAPANFVLKFTVTGHQSAIVAVKFTPDGERLASASSDGSVKIWDILNGKLEKTISAHQLGVTDVAWSSYSRFLVSASYDKTLKIWEHSSGECQKTLRGHSAVVTSCEFNTESNLIVSGSADRSVRLWDVRMGKCLKVLPLHANTVTGVRFGANGLRLVSGSYDGLCRIWDTTRGQLLHEISDKNLPPVGSVEFTANGKYVLIATLNNTLKLWDYSTGKCLKIYAGHRNKIFSISACISTLDAKWIISGSEDHLVYIWSLESEHIVQTLQGHVDTVLCIAYNPFWHIIASGGDNCDKTIKIWKNQRRESWR